VKCKAKRDMKDEKQVTMKNGQGALSGICTVCGTKMFKIGGGGKKIVKAKTASKKPTTRTAKAQQSTKRK
jgi:hypothetical protein